MFGLFKKKDPVEVAQKHLVAKRYPNALRAVEGVEGPEAAKVRSDAKDGLVQMNLDHAISWANAGDGERVNLHLENVAEHAAEHHAPLIRAAEKKIQAIFQGHQDNDQRTKLDEASRMFSVDEDYLAEHASPPLPVPAGVSEAEAEELRARLALMYENYPEALQETMMELGSSFAEAVIALDDGKADVALPLLLALPESAALVQYELARAATALGDPRASIRALRRFADLAGGHQVIGRQSTIGMMAVQMAQLGQHRDALDELRTARKKNKELESPLYASLLEVLDELEEAEQVLRGLIKKYGREATFYTAIARVRMKGGHRAAALQALEHGMERCDCTPGRCGSKPPDLGMHRMLATLYLEDDRHSERGLELAEIAAGLTQQPSWDDAYLRALALRDQDPDATRAITAQLSEHASHDAQTAKVQAHLGEWMAA